MLEGSYHDPWDLVVGLVSEYLDNEASDGIMSTEKWKVDTVDTYDFSGNPTKPNKTAIRILVRPDEDTGENRGMREHSHAIGRSAPFWKFHVVVEIRCYFVRVTRDKDEGRKIASKVSSAVMECLAELPTKLRNIKTADGKWSVYMGADPYIQGEGIKFTDGGPKRPIKSQQDIIVGFILRKY